MMKAAKPLKAHRDSGFKEQLPMILLLVPFFTFFFVFTVLPIISSMVLSLTSSACPHSQSSCSFVYQKRGSRFTFSVTVPFSSNGLRISIVSSTITRVFFRFKS